VVVETRAAEAEPTAAADDDDGQDAACGYEAALEAAGVMAGEGGAGVGLGAKV